MSCTIASRMSFFATCSIQAPVTRAAASISATPCCSNRSPTVVVVVVTVPALAIAAPSVSRPVATLLVLMELRLSITDFITCVGIFSRASWNCTSKVSSCRLCACACVFWKPFDGFMLVVLMVRAPAGRRTLLILLLPVVLVLWLLLLPVPNMPTAVVPVKVVVEPEDCGTVPLPIPPAFAPVSTIIMPSIFDSISLTVFWNSLQMRVTNPTSPPLAPPPPPPLSVSTATNSAWIALINVCRSRFEGTAAV
mmetsp:Transcript_25503/g.42777  ORF Transcript_25503/g.42777 Transcript_25503/m.42777 type:complete len:251 (-) Transcript_25503:552-1304(-)